jgi:hypothetical protein
MENGFAQKLADSLGVTVYAPNTLVWYDRSGITGMTGRLPRPFHRLSDPFDPGKMLTFKPTGAR